MIDSYTKCVCGAITITTDTNTTYSSRRIKKFLPNLDLRKIKRYANTVACDYCANKYGLELCGYATHKRLYQNHCKKVIKCHFLNCSK